jgi:hypothetical protein
MPKGQHGQVRDDRSLSVP